MVLYIDRKRHVGLYHEMRTRCGIALPKELVGKWFEIGVDDFYQLKLTEKEERLVVVVIQNTGCRIPSSCAIKT
jgi:hypothetical protein